MDKATTPPKVVPAERGERIVLVASNDFPFYLFDPREADGTSLFVTDSPALARKARRLGYRAALGNLSDPSLYRRIRASSHDRFLLHLHDARALDRCLKALGRG